MNLSAAERHRAVLIPNERQCMVPLTSQGLYRESQLVWLLNLLSQIKSVPAKKKKKKVGEGGRWQWGRDVRSATCIDLLKT